MAKNRKKTCWVLQMDWELYDDRDSKIELFSSLYKAQEEMSQWIKGDLINYADRFDVFEYDKISEEGVTTIIINEVPFKIFQKGGDPINTKWAHFYSKYSSDFITYCITKQEIK